MRDPYLYEDVDVLINLGDIRDAETLRQAEADVTQRTMINGYYVAGLKELPHKYESE